MNWNLFSALVSNGDFIRVGSFHTNSNELLKQLDPYEEKWTSYNPKTPNIKRYCLPITSLDGELNEGVGSILDANNSENDFNKPTEIYYNSSVLQELLKPWLSFLGRTQILKLPPGGYFPAHVDEGWRQPPQCFRLVVPLKNNNPPNFWWMHGDEKDFKVLNWEEGELYFLNTLKTHALFNTSKKDSYWLIMNIKLCDESVVELKRQIYT